MSELSDIRVLLVEPHQGMRSSIHNMLNLCGVTRIEHGISSGTALGDDFQSSFSPVTAREFRLNILEATQGPTINEIEFK